MADAGRQKKQTRHPSGRRVAIVIFDKGQILDITGPAEILAGANEIIGAARKKYHVDLIAHHAGPVTMSNGIKLEADLAFDAVKPADRSTIDTLIVSGGNGVYKALEDEVLLAFVRDVAKTARRVTSVCTGAYVLAHLGLLNGRRAATHWKHCERMTRAFPKIDVDKDAIYVRDGKYWSSAGVTAGMDLTLGLVEQDHGKSAALTVARNKVMFMMRPGGQSQYSAQLAAQQPASGAFAELTQWILEHVDEDLTVPYLASRVAMSERHFARCFASEVGMPPAKFVEMARVDAARLHLEDTRRPVEQIAWDCGFPNPERMRRAFHRRLGISPNDYRARFSAPSV